MFRNIGEVSLERDDMILYVVKFEIRGKFFSQKYFVTHDTLEYIKQSWAPSGYLKFDAVDSDGVFERSVFLNSTAIIYFESKFLHGG